MISANCSRNVGDETPSIVALRSRRRAGRGGHPNFSGFGLSRLSAAKSFVSRRCSNFAYARFAQVAV
jgi:hypothetical protein